MKKWLPFFPLFVFLLNLILKFLYLTTQEIAHDEPFSIYHAQFGISTLIDQLKGYNNPPLFEIILHYWIKLFGISPLSVRMLPLLFGALGPVALYYFVRKHFSVRTAIVSSLLLSFSTLLVYYSHDCRVYTLFMLLSILSMH
ncbi:MAG: putative rane protein, partial [Bacteroidetes bacterium]|nr:putative rane protein [Bacteroidota bacterium]